MNPIKKNYLFKVARFAHFILGIVFLLAAFSKIGDLQDFFNTVQKIDFFSPLFKGLIVITIPGLELMLGMYMILRIAPQQSAFMATLLLLIFTMLECYLAYNGKTSSCGCIKLSFAGWLMVTGWWAVLRDFGLTLFSLIGLWESGFFRSVLQGYQSFRYSKTPVKAALE